MIAVPVGVADAGAVLEQRCQRDQPQPRIEAPAEEWGVLVKDGADLPENGGRAINPTQPTAKILEPLISPKHGTLGYYAPWWWHYVYDFPSGQNRVSHCPYTG